MYHVTLKSVWYPAGFREVVEGMLCVPGHKDEGARQEMFDVSGTQHVVTREAYTQGAVHLSSLKSARSPAALGDAEMGQAGVGL